VTRERSAGYTRVPPDRHHHQKPIRPVTSGTELVASKSYTCDKASRLTAATIGSNSYTYSFAAPSTCSYTYNASSQKNSNRTSQTINAATTTYCYDCADRLVSSSDAAPTNPAVSRQDR